MIEILKHRMESKALASCEVSSSLRAFASSPLRSSQCTWPQNKHRSNLGVQNPLKLTKSLQHSPSLQQASELPTLDLGKNKVNSNLASHDFHENPHSFNDFPTLLKGSRVHKLRQLPFPTNRPKNRSLTSRSFESRGEEVRLKIEDETRKCECHDQFRELVPYVQAWKWQKVRVEEKVRGLNMGEDVNDTVILLQHPPVYTMGTRSSEEFLKFDVEDPPYELHRTERGGEARRIGVFVIYHSNWLPKWSADYRIIHLHPVRDLMDPVRSFVGLVTAIYMVESRYFVRDSIKVTYHGPGQLVMYPILNLRHHNMDLHWYLRTLEEVVIGALEKSCGIEAHRIPGLTGVWVGNKKVAAIGVRVSRWITYHGLALNVTTDLSPFSNIIPCGISDYTVTSVAKLLDENPHSAWEARNYDPDFLLAEVHGSLLSEFAQKFNFQLVTPT